VAQSDSLTLASRSLISYVNQVCKLGIWKTVQVSLSCLRRKEDK
jgi:hypothetical protein